MKKVVFVFWTVTLCMSMFVLAACGQNKSETAETPAPVEVTEKVSVEKPAAPPMITAAPNEMTYEEEASAENVQESNPMKEKAYLFIGDPVEKLYEQIGLPVRSDYASSCLGSGDDGELVYDGFVVYTYREGDVEVVQSIA